MWASGKGNGSPWTGYALIVGVDVYEDPEFDTKYSRVEALDLQAALLRDVDHWTASNIVLLLDSEATRTNILAELDNLNSVAGSEDVCLFAFSGHGTDMDLLPHDCLGAPVFAWDLATWLDGSVSNHVCIILSSCHSGGIIDWVNWPTNRPGLVVLASTASDESSWRTGMLRSGLFMFYLSESLGQAATDSDGDGMVSAEEAFAYASECVLEWPKDQTPQVYDGHDGPLFLVSRGEGHGGRPVTPAELPLGGGFWGPFGCSRADTAGNPTVFFVVLAAACGPLFWRMRRRPHVLLSAVVAVVASAGCRGGTARHQSLTRESPGCDHECGRRALLPLPATAALPGAAAGTSEGMLLLLGDLDTPDDSAAEPRPEQPRRLAGARLGVAFPLGAAEERYGPAPQLGVWLASSATPRRWEYGIDLCFLQADSADVTATLVFLGAAMVRDLHREPGGTDCYWHVGGWLIVDIIETYWEADRVYEIGAAVGVGVGWRWPDSRWELRLACDALLPAGNIPAMASASGGLKF